jgi:hypothetical protein
MANQIRGKYHTVTVTPTSYAGSAANGKIIFAPTEIPNACYPGGTSILKTIRVFDKDDHGADLDLLFFENKPTVEALGATAVKFTVAGGNNTDALVQDANPLGVKIIDVSEITTLDYTDNQIHIQNSVDLFVKSNPSQSHIDAGTGVPGSIYFMGISTATKTYTATSYTFEFVFETY